MYVYVSGFRGEPALEGVHTLGHDAAGNASPAGVEKTDDAPFRIDEVDGHTVGHRDRQEQPGRSGGMPVRRFVLELHTPRRVIVYGYTGRVHLPSMGHRLEVGGPEYGSPAVIRQRRRGVAEEPQIEGLIRVTGMCDTRRQPGEAVYPLAHRMKRDS
jgi:hypothetical protein